MNDDLLAALEAAVEANPANTALRTHVAELLLKAARFDDALAHAQRVLAMIPDDVQALAVAAESATAAGHDGLAQGYRRLASALGGQPAPAEPTSTQAGAPEARIGGSTPTDDRLPVAADAQDPIDALLDSIVEAYEKSTIRLENVAGMDTVKRQIELSFLGPLRHPELRTAYGASLRGGLLLYGPPGCGKTYLARAIAGELAAAFISVGLHDVLDMWLGNSEKQVHELFELARRSAPTVLFFDEVDALGMKRADFRGGVGKNVVTQLLAELDGFNASNDGVFVLGATNQPWDVDSALRRPGRFDRTILVLPPDEQARQKILTDRLAAYPLGTLDVHRLAKRCDGYSGADLGYLVESAAQLAMADAVSLGGVVPISQRHLDRAGRDLRPSTGTWFETARNAAMFANRDGQYDDLLTYLSKRR